VRRHGTFLYFLCVFALFAVLLVLANHYAT
jgi:hypothetical protein